MKTKKLLILLVLLFLTVNANAFLYFEIDGIYYIIDEHEKYAKIGSGDNNLYDVVIPEFLTIDNEKYPVTQIDEYAFSGSNLVSVTIPNSVKNIGKWAFSWCPNLTTVTIGNGLESIRMDAFERSNKISTVNISDIESWCKITFETIYSNPLSIARHLYMNGSEVNEIVIPNSISSIEKYAFYNCQSLTSVTIPKSVTSIGMQAFWGCSITKVNISDVEAWCKIDFANASANPLSNNPHLYLNNTEVTNLKIPNSITAIKDYSFYGCGGLNSIDIPNSVESIGENAFVGCDMTSVTIPNSVRSIGMHAFEGCSLTSVDIPESVIQMGDSAFCGCIYMTSAIINSQIIADYAFDRCKSLNSLTIGSETTSIGKCAFRRSNITTLKIGDGVTTIDRNAFSSCKSLTSLEIGKNVTYIETGAFLNCNGLSSIVVNEGNKAYDSRNNCNAIIHTITNELVLGCQNTIIPNDIISIGDMAFYACSNLSSIFIPNGVTKIGQDAFADCISLPSINLPNKLSSIGKDAFGGCIGLNSIIIPNSVEFIGDDAFYGCTGLTSMIIPSNVKEIGYGIFTSCDGLTSIVVEEGNSSYDSRNNCNAIINSKTDELIAGCQKTIIPNDVKGIGKEAFYCCGGLTSANIPNGVTNIGDYAFFGCTGLTSVNIPNGVTKINEGTFSFCEGLSTLNIPNSVTSIGEIAFWGCTNLSSIVIPNSITNIGCEAFSECTYLKDVYCEAEQLSSEEDGPGLYADEYAFGYYWDLGPITLHVPEVSMDLYLTTEPWKNLANIIPLTDDDPKSTEIPSLKSDNNIYHVEVYTLDGKRMSHPKRGLNIIRMSDGKTKKMIMR